MDEKRLLEIFSDDSIEDIDVADDTFQGLLTLSKYTENLICGADHDVIYSESITVVVENGLTEEDAIHLKKLGWMIEDEDYFYHFV